MTSQPHQMENVKEIIEFVREKEGSDKNIICEGSQLSLCMSKKESAFKHCTITRGNIIAYNLEKNLIGIKTAEIPDVSFHTKLLVVGQKDGDDWDFFFQHRDRMYIREVESNEPKTAGDIWNIKNILEFADEQINNKKKKLTIEAIVRGFDLQFTGYKVDREHYLELSGEVVGAYKDRGKEGFIGINPSEIKTFTREEGVIREEFLGKKYYLNLGTKGDKAADCEIKIAFLKVRV